MAINESIVLSTLNDLIETLKDGKYGYKTAADAVNQSDLKNLFEQYSGQRQEYLAELKTIMSRMGVQYTDSGSITGAIQRGWINLKTAVSTKDTRAILNECEKGEDAAVKEYSEALDENLPPHIKLVISRQYNGIKAVHDRVRQLANLISPLRI